MGTMVVVVVKATVNRAEKGGYRRVDERKTRPSLDEETRSESKSELAEKTKGKEKRGF